MFAADPPAVVQPSETSDLSDVIEVVGSRPDQAVKIDRRTYRVQQTPHSEQKDAIQLLRGLPAVTISPDDEINLLGSGNVTIFVDGRKYAGDARQYLRTLHGRDIERIEIITNPSAQYSAEGTGGIINFVLRHKQGEGVSGTASSELTSVGHGNADASVKIKHGPWTYEFEAHGWFGRRERSKYHKLRTVEAIPAGTATTNTEDGDRRSSEVREDASAKITYELDAKTSVSAKVRGGEGRDVRTVDANFTGITPDFQSFTEHQRTRDVAPFVIGELTFDHKGSKQGETLNASVQLAGNPGGRTRNAAQFSDGSAFIVQQFTRVLFGRGQIDWEHPMGTGEILSVGGNWDFLGMSQHYRFTSEGSDGSLGPNSVDQYNASNNTFAGYTTLQQPIGSWTVMPGIRIEQNSRRISSPGLPDVKIDPTSLFPTFHADHPLSKTLDLTLSYSKRIDRAQADILRPFRAVESALTIMQGNPRLKDQSTDSYEINLHYHRKTIDAGIIVYDRETSRLWSTDYTAINGVNIYTWVNAGRRSDRGAEFDLSAPILKRVKINASVNLFDERAPVDATVAAASEDTFRYTTNATLEWVGPDHGKVPGDVAQLQWQYNSPSRQFQLRFFDWNSLSLSYTHSFSRGLSLNGTMNYWGANRHRLLAPLVQEFYSQRSPVEFKLKLLKTFGKP